MRQFCWGADRDGHPAAPAARDPPAVRRGGERDVVDRVRRAGAAAGAARARDRVSNHERAPRGGLSADERHGGRAELPREQARLGLLRGRHRRRRHPRVRRLAVRPPVRVRRGPRTGQDVRARSSIRILAS